MTKRNVYIAPDDYSNLLNNGDASIRQKFFDNPDYNIVRTDTINPYKTTFTKDDIIIGGAGANKGIGSDVNTNGALRLWGPDRAATANAVSGYNDYQNMAEDIINPTYNANVQAAKNAAKSKITALKNSKSSINDSYDEQAENQNRQNFLNQNNFNNNVNSRGLARSTIATSGLAGINNTNNRILNTIENYRSNALNNVDTQIANVGSSLADTLEQMDRDKNSQISAQMQTLKQNDYNNALQSAQLTGLLNGNDTLAKQQLNNELLQRDIDNRYRQNAFDYQKNRDTVSDSQWQQEFNLEKQRALSGGGSGSGGSSSRSGTTSSGGYKSSNGLTMSSSEIKKYQLLGDLDTIEKKSGPQAAYDYLLNNPQPYINYYGQSGYQRLLQQYRNYIKFNE